MTFAEYNTDDIYDKKESSLEELVNIGKAEGKSIDEIKTSLSPKWQKSKYINELENYYNKPKEEVKKEVIKTAPSSKTDSYIESQNAIADKAQEDAEKDLEKNRAKNLKELESTLENMGKSFGNIDDHYIEQLPISLRRRFKNGEFGDPESVEAKSRRNYFIVDSLANALKVMSNRFAANAGRSPVFADTKSAYEKYQDTNFAKGMENRWKKYEAETQNAINMASKEMMTEQDARLAVQALTRNNKLNTKWNMMNEKQKLYAMEITKEMGDYVGKMNMDELANFVAGAALNEGANNISKDEVIAIGLAKLASKSPDIVKNFPEGNVKDMVLSMIGGNSDGIIEDITAGIGGSGGSSEKGDPGVTLEDGTVVNPGTWMNGQEYKDLVSAADKLSQQYYNGEIDAEKFKSEYAKLEKVMSEHGIMNTIRGIKSGDDLIKINNENKIAELDEKLRDLNTKASYGEIKPSDYEEQFNKLKETASKFNATKKQIEYFDKKKITTDAILKAIEKNLRRNK